jgi:hypothetical protein
MSEANERLESRSGSSPCCAGLCMTCHWWFRFDESQLVGDCIWHNGTKHTVASKLRFKGLLKTQADFGCVSWERDRRDCPVCKYPKHDCRCENIMVLRHKEDN